MVDIGGGVTDVAVYYRNVPRYIASIPIGAGAINNDIRTLGILERHVDSLKRKFGSAVAELAPENKMVSVKGRTAKETKEILLRNLAVVIESRVRDIAEYVAQEIKDSGFGDKLAYGIVLTGGSAQLQHIDELFRRTTGMEVRIGTAEEAVDAASKEQAASPACATGHRSAAQRRSPRRLRRDRSSAAEQCSRAACRAGRSACDALCGPGEAGIPRRAATRRSAPCRRTGACPARHRSACAGGRRRPLPERPPRSLRTARGGDCSTSSSSRWATVWTISSRGRRTRRFETPPVAGEVRKRCGTDNRPFGIATETNARGKRVKEL